MNRLFDEFYNELLEKVLNHPKVQASMKESKEAFPELTQYEIESNAIEDFFSLDYEEIFSIDEIYEDIVESVKDEVEYITSGKKILADEINFKLEDYVIEKLEDIRDELERALERKYIKTSQPK